MISQQLTIQFSYIQLQGWDFCWDILQLINLVGPLSHDFTVPIVLNLFITFTLSFFVSWHSKKYTFNRNIINRIKINNNKGWNNIIKNNYNVITNSDIISIVLTVTSLTTTILATKLTVTKLCISNNNSNNDNTKSQYQQYQQN